MPYTNSDTNMTTSAGLTPGMQTYYNRTLLETFEPKLVHIQFGDEKVRPANSGRTMNLRKWVPIPTNTSELQEGNPGESVMLTETEVTIEMKQHGEYARCSELLDMVHIDANIEDRVSMFGDAGARSVDALVRDELATCTNVLYANNKTARSALAATDKLTSKEIRKAVKILKKANAQTFDGYYVAIVGPDVIYDLQDDDDFIKVGHYQNKEAIFSGEVGRLWGVRFVESTEAKIFENAGASGADVASIIVLGKHAYGYSGLKGVAKPRVIVKPAGSAGTADPLDQISTVGWKVDLFGVKMLQPEYAVRIECGFTA